jgi:hypothetical protein
VIYVPATMIHRPRPAINLAREAHSRKNRPSKVESRSYKRGGASSVGEAQRKAPPPGRKVRLSMMIQEARLFVRY